MPRSPRSAWHHQGPADDENKANLPEEALCHLFAMNIGGPGLVQITRGECNDLDGRYRPDRSIVFLATRRGQFARCGTESAMVTVA